MMFFKLFIGLSVGLAISQLAIAGGFSVTPKPRAPIGISIEALSTIKNNSEIDFRVTAGSAIDSQAISVTVELPQHVNLISGALSWQGELNRGKDHSFVFTLAVDPARSFSLLAHMSAGVNSGQVLNASADFYYENNRVNTAAAINSGPRTKVRHQGTVVEFPLN